MIPQPIHEKILVRPFPPETEIGGIIIPPSVQERPSKATVVAVGDGTKDRPMVMEIGDTVFHVLNAGTPIEHEGELLYILRDVDCLARIPYYKKTTHTKEDISTTVEQIFSY